MSQQPDLTTTDLRAQRPSQAVAWRLVQAAPVPEAPDAPDRAARQKGMAIVLGAGAAFWGGVGAVAWYLLNS